MVVQFQACIFKREKDSITECGIARLKCGWGVHDIEFIMDVRGNQVPEVWTYTLRDGPLCYLEMLENKSQKKKSLKIHPKKKR